VAARREIKMAINIDWRNDEKRVLILAFEGTFSWDELRTAYEQAWDMVRSQPHVVAVINDATKRTTAPSGNAFGSYRTIWNERPDNLGTVYVIGSSTAGRMVSAVFMKALRLDDRLRYVGSIEEAEELIASIETKEE
jgi:hypothetical protein